MRRRLRGLAAAVAAVAAVSGCGITSTGVIGFGSLPSGAASKATSVPAGYLAYNVYFQIGAFLEPEQRNAPSTMTGADLYKWLLQQIAAGPNSGELAEGFAPPDDVISQIQMISYQPTQKAASAALNVATGQMSGNDEGQIVCTLNQVNLDQSGSDDAFGILFTDGDGLSWFNCSDYPIVNNIVTPTSSPSP